MILIYWLRIELNKSKLKNIESLSCQKHGTYVNHVYLPSQRKLLVVFKSIQTEEVSPVTFYIVSYLYNDSDMKLQEQNQQLM